MNKNVENKIERLIEETRKIGTGYQKGGGILPTMRRNMAAKASKVMRKEVATLRNKGDNLNANFIDNERRAHSAGLSPKSKEALANKKVASAFDGHNKEKSYDITTEQPRIFKSAKK